MKKVFITGGTGFIGKSIVKQLDPKKYELYILTRKNKINDKQVHFIKGDISDRCLLQNAMNVIRPDILVHLAWDVKNEDYANSLENYKWRAWSEQLAECFLSAGGKEIVAAGTCFEYDLSLGKPLDEKSPCKPNTLYGKCKLHLSRLVEKKCKLTGARFAWGRIFYPYGVGESERKLFSSAIHSLKQEKAFVYSAENVIDYIHESDVAGMFVQLIENDHLSGVFNIGSGVGYNIGELVMGIARKIGKEHLVFFKTSEMRQLIISDNRKILSAPYKLQYDIDQGEEEMIEKMSDMKCPLCGSSKLEHFAQRVGVPTFQNVSFRDQIEAQNIKKGNIDLVSCEDCSFVFNMHFEEIIYSDTYENDQSFSACFAQHMDYLAEKVSKTVNSLEGKVKIIEIGCGQGGFLKNVISKISSDINYQAIGFDPACREISADEKFNIRFISEYFSQDYLEGEAFDDLIIIARHVIEHISEIHEFFQDISRTNVRGDRYLFLETPDFDWVLRNVKFEDIVYEHCSFFNPKSIRYLLSQYDCEFIQIEKVFQEQYMWIEAKFALENRIHILSEYQKKEKFLIEKWRCFLIDAYEKNEKVYVWGAGAKGVNFANLLDPSKRYIQAIVDINPKKAGMFLAGSGHKIIDPEECAKCMPEKIVVMNKIYFEEIQSYLFEASRNKLNLEILCI